MDKSDSNLYWDRLTSAVRKSILGLLWNRLFFYWNRFSVLVKRSILSILFLFDSCLGLLHNKGLLNVVDLFLVGNLPPDFVWLLQTFQMICVGFFFVKILFDNVPPSRVRTILMCMSPFLLIIHVLFSLHVLLVGQNLVVYLFL